MVLFTCNVKKIKGAAHKNGDIGSSCKRDLRPGLHIRFFPPFFSLFYNVLNKCLQCYSHTHVTLKYAINHYKMLRVNKAQSQLDRIAV